MNKKAEYIFDVPPRFKRDGVILKTLAIGCCPEEGKIYLFETGMRGRGYEDKTGRARFNF